MGSALAAGLITKGDFRIDKAGSNAGTLYGRGIYLAESCAKSDEYTTPDSDDLRYILIVRSCLGRLFYTDEMAPDVDKLVNSCVGGPYHSVLGDRDTSLLTGGRTSLGEVGVRRVRQQATIKRILPTRFLVGTRLVGASASLVICDYASMYLQTRLWVNVRAREVSLRTGRSAKRSDLSHQSIG